ncbi:MAG: LysM peptidoglycan-binding domain-containing protein, partial [Desulfobacteraceae bacterium]|nr:LysM peptidoglycan-binding domain-containing protein [Desulfobacteraceae bacterium]
PSYQPVKPPDGIARTSGEEGNNEPQSIPADARRESAGRVELQRDGGEAAAKFGDSKIIRHFPAAASSRRVVVKRGDTLLKIAADQYPRDTEGGFQAIVRANPDVTNPNQIFPGQTIILPELNVTPPGIRYMDNQYYADYGRYRSLEDLKQATQLLASNTIRFFITALNDPKGDQVYQITLGGYARLPDLAKAMEILKTSVRWNRTSG